MKILPLTKNPQSVVALDVGGTKISGALLIFDKSKTIPKDTLQVKTHSTGTSQEVIVQIIECIAKLITPYVDAICIGLPSSIRQETGEVLYTNNIATLTNIDVVSHIQKQFHIPVFIDNDANCFALGAFIQHSDIVENFSSQGVIPFVGLTLGTGIGCGVIINGKIVQGAHTAASEIWQLPYKDKTYESYASSKFFYLHNISPKNCFELAQQNDNKALRIYEEFGKNVAHVIYLCVCTYNPKKIIIGGSIAKSQEFFHPSVLRELRKILREYQYLDLEIIYDVISDTVLKGVGHLAFIRS